MVQIVYEFIIVSDIVGLIEKFRCQDKAYCSRREVVECAPYILLNEQPLPGMVKMKALAGCAIVDVNGERATDGYYQFTALLMGMASAALARWHIVCPIHTLHIERHLLHALSHGEIATWVEYLWQIYYLTLTIVHYLFVFLLIIMYLLH